VIKTNDIVIWNNIRKSQINQAGARPCIISCADIIEVIIKQTNIDNRWIVNTKGHPIASFQPSSLDLCYKFLDAEKIMDADWFEAYAK